MKFTLKKPKKTEDDIQELDDGVVDGETAPKKSGFLSKRAPKAAKGRSSKAKKAIAPKKKK